MITYTIDSQKSIYSLNNSTMQGKMYLKWMSSGHSMFLILFGENNRAVDLSRKENQDLLSELLTTTAIQELHTNKELLFKEEKLQVFLYTHTELMRDGGMSIKEKPGVYAVYGLDNSVSDSLVVYLSEVVGNSQNMLTMLLDVTIEQKPVYMEKKSFLKKSMVYSGYHEVRLNKPYPGLTGGVLKYRINNYTFPFPDKVVKDGGVFYVQVEESSTMDFNTNNPGIRIR